MSEKSFDLIVVGAGPGGYVAAIRAAQLGLKTAVVERAHLGGICLNWGCIPTKALLKSAEVYTKMKHSTEYGLSVKDISFDLKKIVERSRGVAKQLSGGVGFLLKKNKVEIIMGEGKLKSAGVLEVKGEKITETLKAKHIILATGARAREFSHFNVDHKIVWTYKDALKPNKMPKKLLVVGSGAIGMEFASFYNALGAEVTVVEMMDRILINEDAEIAKIADGMYKKQGLNILASTTVVKVELKDDSALVTLEGKDKKTTVVEVDRVILAAGVVPNTENLGLENTKVKLEKNNIIKVNQWYETDEKGVYAIGDIIEGPWLAHKASHDGVICVEKIAGVKDVHPMNKSLIPSCTYSTPQIASVGLTEEAAKVKGQKIKVGRFPFVGNGRAISMGENEGLVKTIFDEKTGELLGAHMVGAEVTELIQGYTVAMNLETTETELMHTIFAHPTLSEMLHESVLDAYKKAIHI